MRLIPGKTKVDIELFKGVSLADMLVGGVGAGMLIFVIASNMTNKLIWACAILAVSGMLLFRIDSEPNYIYVLHILQHFTSGLRYKKSQPGGEAAGGEAAPAETKEQRKARLKAEAEEYKADEKKLKDKKTTKVEADAIWLKRANQSAAKKAQKKEAAAENPKKIQDISEIIPFTGVKNGFIEYAGSYFGAVIEINPVEFRFFSPNRRRNSVENGVGRIIRAISNDYSMNIVKLECPILYDEQLAFERTKLGTLKKAFENGMFSEDELKSRLEVIQSRIERLENLCFGDKVLGARYFIVLYDSDKAQLNTLCSTALDNLRSGEIEAHRLTDPEIAVFLRYSNEIDFDEREIKNVAPEDYAKWASPSTVNIGPRTIEVNGIVSHNMRVVNYASEVGDAWLASVMSIPGTKVVVKARPADRQRSIRGIDRALQELRSQYVGTGVDSKRIEIQSHIDSLSELLATLQGDNETLLDTNVYITAYDVPRTKVVSGGKAPETCRPIINYMKRTIRRYYSEANMRLNNMEFTQFNAFVGGQISAFDPLLKSGRGMPGNTVAAMYPWVFSVVCDKKGFCLGSSDGLPVFVDFFRRDSERVNSNMVIVGKSGSGKSYATKTILSNLAADDSKVFILDPENEYSELAHNLHGKYINVGNASHGRLNPFHIITALDDDENSDASSSSYATHLQFLEEFYRQIIPDCSADALEYLNSMTDRMYTNKGITAETDLSKLRPEDYPIFDDLYDTILSEFQATDNNYIRTILRTLMNYVSKFSTGGRNATIWNGPSTVTTDENFTVFNFQSLLANRNGAIANAQMLLVLKYVDNEIIKNRDYNTKYKASRKIIVVIDEAHVFIDNKYPAALDFMFQLAKRIRKYNGMQIVITQNIKDFVGSEDIARKSTAIINACQYSFIFPLAPNDMDDLCKLYEKAGGINETEQEQIVGAPRGQAFSVMSPQSRSTMKIETPQNIIHLFRDKEYEGYYYAGDEGEALFEEYIAGSRELHDMNSAKLKREAAYADRDDEESKSHVTFMEFSEEDASKAYEKTIEKRHKTKMGKTETEKAQPVSEIDLEDQFPDIPDIPEDPEEFIRIMASKNEKGELGPSDKVDEIFITKEKPKAEEKPAPSATEQVLSQLLGSFSMESIRNEVRKAVLEELSEKGVNVSSVVEEEEKPRFTDDEIASLVGSFREAQEKYNAENGIEPDSDDDDSEDGSSVLFEEVDESELGESTDSIAEDDSAFEFEDDMPSIGLSLSDLLAEQINKLNESNSSNKAIDNFDGDISEISLDDLTKFNDNQKS